MFVQLVLPALHAFVLNFTLYVSDNVKNVCDFDLVLKETEWGLLSFCKFDEDSLFKQGTDRRKAPHPVHILKLAKTY